MVDSKLIKNVFDDVELKNKISNIIKDNITITSIDVGDKDLFQDVTVKCSTNSATNRGEGAKVHLANDPDGEKVPLRHLQDEGFNENGEHMGYIADITYPDGTKIDYYHGTLTIDGKTYQMGFDDNYKTDSQGNMVHDPKGSANELFKSQWTNMSNEDKRVTARMGKNMGKGNTLRLIEEMEKKGVDTQRRSVKGKFHGTPVGDVLIESIMYDNNIKKNGAVTSDIVVGEQVSKNSMRTNDAIRINDNGKPTFTNTSVGFLNDMTLNAHDKVTGDSRSVTGQVNNWDNTYKIYTVIPGDSGTNALYLGYGQNASKGVWDNSANTANQLIFARNQKFKKVLVDKTNGVIIQVPVND